MTAEDIINHPNSIIIDEDFEDTLSLLGAHQRDITFRKCTFMGGLIYTLQGSIKLIDCIFKDDSTLNFYRPGVVVIENSKFTTLSINKANIEIRDTSITGKLSAISMTRLDVRNSTKCSDRIENLYLGDSSEPNIVFENLNVGNVTSSSHNGSLNIINGNFDLINLASTIFKKIYIRGENNDRPKIGELILSKISIQESINLKKCIVGNFKLNNFSISESKEFQIQAVEFHGDVEIKESDLSGIQFLGVSFEKAHLFLDWSFITEVKIANVIWPKNKVVQPDLANNKLEELRKQNKDLTAVSYNVQRETYRQLKSISLKVNNNIDALEFYKNEMRVYYKSIVEGANYPWWHRDRILVKINRVVSNFGQSYTRPLLFLLGSNLVFYIALICVSKEYNYTGFEQAFGEYMYLLNPLHKSPDKLEGFGLAIDFIMRVFAGFFIYHFVKATRKFGKV